MDHKFIADRAAKFTPSVLMQLQSMMSGMDDIIDLSIGDPDFTTPEPILTAGYQDALKGYTHYSPAKGYPDVIQAVIDSYKKKLNIDLDADRVIIEASSAYSCFLACFATINPGDEILLADPTFLAYKAQIAYAGGVPVFFPTYEEDHWRIKAKNAEPFITEKTKGIFLCNPNNPNGACLHKEDLQAIYELAEKYDLLIYADEIYTSYSYEVPFTSMLTIPGAAERTIVLNSLSKNFVATGARLGWVIAPPEIITSMMRLGVNVVYTAPSISQRMAKFALEQGEVYLEPIMAEFKERMFKTAERINRIPHLSVQSPPPGSFYLFVNVKETGLDDVEFTMKVLKEAHVTVVPGSDFGDQGKGYVRICATLALPKLLEACDRIEKLGL
ncbi:MAG: aminotransferase class I/II-fold pyridoxal phosphate-dependent enzyme [Firmicutes bacterium]|nr:aminotransferase class I/II-fold pyridoxal phosphate-dependent enzyme [Bacillota bacterium]